MSVCSLLPSCMHFDRCICTRSWQYTPEHTQTHSFHKLTSLPFLVARYHRGVFLWLGVVVFPFLVPFPFLLLNVDVPQAKCDVLYIFFLVATTTNDTFPTVCASHSYAPHIIHSHLFLSPWFVQLPLFLMICYLAHFAHCAGRATLSNLPLTSTA